MRRVICISREFGSGGHDAAKTMIEENLDYKSCTALVKRIAHTYDVCLNSATMGIDRIAHLIIDAYEKMKGEA